VTEAEWLACDDLGRLLHFAHGQISSRKHRLFACACYRRKWKYVSDERCHEAVEITEAFADDEDRIGDFDRVCDTARLARNEWFSKQGSQGRMVHLATAASWLTSQRPSGLNVAYHLAPIPVDSARARRAETTEQVHLLRDIFGNPFRPVAFDPTWRTEAVVGLARGAYEDRAFDRLPVLADALEDAGCADAAVLAHCRGPGPHVRGCWVVDLILGKA
jgi:hypothetical protein